MGMKSKGDWYYLMVLQTLIDDVCNGNEKDTILQLSEAKGNKEEKEEKEKGR